MSVVQMYECKMNIASAVFNLNMNIYGNSILYYSVPFFFSSHLYVIMYLDPSLRRVLAQSLETAHGRRDVTNPSTAVRE